MYFKCIYIVFFYLITFLCFSEDIKVGTTQDGTTEFIITDSIKKTKYGINYTLLSISKNKIERKSSNRLLDCENQKWQLLKLKEWNHEKKEWKTVGTIYNNGADIIPDIPIVESSSGWWQMKFICSYFNNWTSVSKSKDGKETNYLDFDKTSQSQELVYFWRLNDYTKKTQFGDLSVKSKMLCDCKKYKFKYLERFYYTDNMARGTISAVSLQPDRNWQKIPNEAKNTTTIGNIVSLICDKYF